LGSVGIPQLNTRNNQIIAKKLGVKIGFDI
jgi:hypothetical protein